ncbi:hypothetical protein A2765_02930 [Candidatus Kaiserbacteria bacterium RIFCSPHIGHO2_01_FULL_56_24]|uniref:Uncharacterized protein n=1 Tax=Candidatus Kaiserbacteria bacterium RIFCSPHIGHO2_01_FULL_56_24 TaxID=1798487 RepID=A0A1F6DGD4_9BACT|nr:MAG: hypothetical protein A2765_02930 [Candidatus Kaiserbacteria bacterium RIFCSPHIGHO2_01_FULL_56_24]
MKKKQRYDNRLFDVEEVMEVLSIYYGVMTVEQFANRTQSLYPKTWRARTLIRVHRTEYSSSPYGLGYGPDWRGEKILIQPDGSKKVFTSHAIKKDLIAYQKQGRIPGYAMKVASEQIRFAATVAWMAYRATYAKASMNAVHK